MKKNIIFIYIIYLVLSYSGCYLTFWKEKKPEKQPKKKIEAPRDFSVLFMGDLMIVRDGEEYIEKDGGRYPFLLLEDYFRKFDVVFANLEASITYRGKVHSAKPYTFRLHPDNAHHFSKLKIDVYCLSNNHMLDFGVEGMRDTVNFVKKWGAKYTGVGEDIYEARRPAVVKINGTELVFLAYCERPPRDFYATETKPGTAPLNLEYIKEDVKKYKNDNNFVFVSLHWGIEHRYYPERYQVKEARSIIDWGADAVIGHHPHVPQGIEVYKNKPIIYSLGNAVSGFHNPHYGDNIFAYFTMSSRRIKNLTIVPVEGDYGTVKGQPYIQKGDDAVKTLFRIKKYSFPFNTNISIERNVGIIDFLPVQN